MLCKKTCAIENSQHKSFCYSCCAVSFCWDFILLNTQSRSVKSCNLCNLVWQNYFKRCSKQFTKYLITSPDRTVSAIVLSRVIRTLFLFTPFKKEFQWFLFALVGLGDSRLSGARFSFPLAFVYILVSRD